jgi:hypothetical protein
VLTHVGPVAYLDKFAVTNEAQGEGIGGSLWQRLARDVPRLYWRARLDNPINPWYFQRADGSYSRGNWTVFWTGLGEFAEIQDCRRARPRRAPDPRARPLPRGRRVTATVGLVGARGHVGGELVRLLAGTRSWG